MFVYFFVGCFNDSFASLVGVLAMCVSVSIFISIDLYILCLNVSLCKQYKETHQTGSHYFTVIESVQGRESAKLLPLKEQLPEIRLSV